MDSFVGKLVQVRIVLRSSRELLGLYRFPHLGKSTALAKFEKLADARTTYVVEVYADANGNNTFDPPSDKVWTMEVTSTREPRGDVRSEQGQHGRGLRPAVIARARPALAC